MSLLLPLLSTTGSSSIGAALLQLLSPLPEEKLLAEIRDLLKNR